MTRQRRPALVLPAAFALLIALGTALLKLPVALEPGRTLTWLDALFTATSAACLAGLAVNTTGDHFTPVGQAVIGVLIQLGGLGILIFGAAIVTRMGRYHSLPGRNAQEPARYRMRAIVPRVVIATLVIELIGAAALYVLWDDTVTGLRRLGWSAFHAVSAFCNAGFDLTGNSLVPYRYGLATHLVIAPLIVLGGLGFPVMADLLDAARSRARRRFRPHSTGADRGLARLSPHTKIALSATATLYVAGFVAIAAGQVMPYLHGSLQQGVTAHAEGPQGFHGAAALGIIGDASFQSITARTAGFHSLPMGEVQPAGRFSTVPLMLIGSAAGGAAGGMTITALAILLLSALSALRQKRRAEAFGHPIGEGLVSAALAVAVAYVALVVVGTLLLTLSEPFPLEKLLFEAVSAVATAGLSLGVTPELSAFGKIVVIALMFLGRTAALVLLSAALLPGGRGRSSQGT